MWLDYEPSRDIFLVFMNSPYPMDFIFKDGFKHVYAIERQALGWVCSDPSKSDLHTYILPAKFESDVMGEFVRRHPEFTILHLQVRIHDIPIYPMPGIISCVSLIQYMIGVYWPFIFTPYKLYNKLRSKPPKHIEVIACHDSNPTQPKERPRQQHKPQT